MNRYYNPVRTIEGAGCVGQLPDVLAGMGLTQKKVLLLVWGETVLEHPAFAALLKNGSGFEIHPLVFQASNPTVGQLYETYQATKSFQPEAVVAVGGGISIRHNLDFPVHQPQAADPFKHIAHQIANPRGLVIMLKLYRTAARERKLLPIIGPGGHGLQVPGGARAVFQRAGAGERGLYHECHARAEHRPLHAGGAGGQGGDIRL